MANRRQRVPNPVSRYKREAGLTYPKLAKVLGCSYDLVKKLGSEQITSVSPAMAMQFEQRSGGSIQYADLMAWIYDRARAENAA
jgi:plasmid maintenance system antidote protein VapI